MTKRAGMDRLFPAALVILLILSVLNLFGDHRFGGGVPIFILGCAATVFVFLIGTSMKTSPETDADEADGGAADDSSRNDRTTIHEVGADWYMSDMDEANDDFPPAISEDEHYSPARDYVK